MLRCSERAEPSWIERPQTSASTLRKKNLKKNWKMTEKNNFSFFFNENAEQHVTGGITCRTAYIHDPQVKGHPKKMFSKIKKNKQKNLFFSKKKRLPNGMLRCSDRAEPSWIERPQTSTSTLKKKFLKRNRKMTEKNDFSFSSNCYQRLTLGKCRTRAERHVTGSISCRTAYIHDPRVKGHPKKLL